jgi:hypothetical protein
MDLMTLTRTLQASAIVSLLALSGVALAQPVVNGWTQIAPSADTRMVYVSSSEGDDGNSGLSPGSPKRTIAAGYELLRDGYPDWLLLKKGDEFYETVAWLKGGRSENEKILMTSYGAGPRPVLMCGSHNGIEAWGEGDLNHIGFVGIALKADTWDGYGDEPSGIRWIRAGEDMLIEDCEIEGFSNNVIIQGYPGVRRDTSIRRNVLVDPMRRDPNNGSTNIYMGQYDGVLIEENVMDNSSQREAEGAMLSHNIYLGEGNPSNNVIRGNIAHNGGRTNFNQRSGGLIENNLSIRGAQGITVGISYAPTWVSTTIRDNVITESRDNQNGQYLGFGISLEKVDGADVYGNLICNSTDGHDHKALVVQSDAADVRLHDNVVFRWQSPGSEGWDTVKVTGVPLGSVSITNNTLQQPSDSHLITVEAEYVPANVTVSGNRYWSQRSGAWCRSSAQEFDNAAWRSYDADAVYGQMSFPNSARTVGSYNATQGGAWSSDDFMAQARLQSKDYWRPAYTAAAVNDYLRAGFGMATLGGTGGGTGPAPTCPADVNRDSRLNVLDFNAFLNAFSTRASAGDFDRDGAYTVMDFTSFQNAFGRGCQ